MKNWFIVRPGKNIIMQGFRNLSYKVIITSTMFWWNYQTSYNRFSRARYFTYEGQRWAIYDYWSLSNTLWKLSHFLDEETVAVGAGNSLTWTSNCWAWWEERSSWGKTWRAEEEERNHGERVQGQKIDWGQEKSWRDWFP